MTTTGRQVIALSVVAAVVAAFAGLAIAVGVTESRPPDVLEQKVADAQRHLYYTITAARGPAFELTGDETTLRVIAHAVMPDGVFDPATEIEYGVRVEMTVAGKPWRRDVFTRARQSKARRIEIEREGERESLWLDENTFSLKRGLELSDDRQFVFALPANLAPSTRVRVTLLGAAHEGIVRAYAPIPRVDIERKLAAMRPIDRERLADQIGYAPWDRIASARQLADLRFAERRLSAEGKEGVDYDIREVYTTGFRMRDAALVERGELVSAEHGMAVNVVGPAFIDVTVRRAGTRDAAAGNLVVRLVGEGTPPAPVLIPLPDRDTTSVHAVSIPEGVWSLTVSSTAAARVELLGPEDKAVSLGGLPGVPLVADEQRLATYLATRDDPPVTVAIEGPPDPIGRVIRIDVRALASAPSVVGQPLVRTVTPDPSVVRGTVTIEAVSADGRVLATSSAGIETEVSGFELARLFGKREALVCEPVGVRFVAPNDATALRVRTDVPALVAMSAPIGSEATPEMLEPPYDTVPLVTMVWRYARFVERGWLPVRASNHAALYPERIVTLAAQARLEPRIEPPAPEVAGSSLQPLANLERQVVIERIAPADATDAILRWGPGNYTRLVPGRKVSLDFSRSPDRPTLQYHALRLAGADTEVVGAKVVVKLDGKPLDDQVFTATGGTLDLPAGLAGTHALEIETAAPVRLMIDRPPVGAGELYALRTVYRIPGGGQAVRLRVTKRAVASENVNLVLYTPKAAEDPATTLRVTIDGGAPARVVGVALAKWSLADRTLLMPATDRPATLGFTDIARGGALYPRLVAVALGDDLPPGTHTLELRVNGARPVWGRFFVLDGGVTNAPRALQWRAADDTSAGSSE